MGGLGVGMVNWGVGGWDGDRAAHIRRRLGNLNAGQRSQPRRRRRRQLQDSGVSGGLRFTAARLLNPGAVNLNPPHPIPSQPPTPSPGIAVIRAAWPSTSTSTPGAAAKKSTAPPPPPPTSGFRRVGGVEVHGRAATQPRRREPQPPPSHPIPTPDTIARHSSNPRRRPPSTSTSTPGAAAKKSTAPPPPPPTSGFRRVGGLRFTAARLLNPGAVNLNPPIPSHPTPDTIARH